MDSYRNIEPRQSCHDDEPDLTVKTSTLLKNNRKWDLHKDENFQFYIEENHALRLTMNAFEQKYGLRASTRKWKLKLDEWEFNKNLRTNEMLFILNKGEKRAAEEGKDTIFLRGGLQIKRQKIVKFKKRNMLDQNPVEKINPRTPEVITYHTPQLFQDITSCNLQPSFQDPPAASVNEYSSYLHLSTTEEGAFHQEGISSMDDNYEPNELYDPISDNHDAPHQSEIESREKTCLNSAVESVDCYLSREAPNLVSIPSKVFKKIVHYLNLGDAFTLSCTCKQFRRLLYDEKYCESMLKLCHQCTLPNRRPPNRGNFNCLKELMIFEEKASYSKKEAFVAMREKKGYASAFRRISKRRLAVHNASPFLCATVGFADSYLYCSGTLCYILDDRLRILNLHDSANIEDVVSLPDLLRDAAPEGYDGRTGIIQILYFYQDIVGCIFTPTHLNTPKQRALLIVFDIGTRLILAVQSIQSAPKTFARFNRNFLYLGTNSGNTTNGLEEWIIKCYDFKCLTWFKEAQCIPDVMGSHIGSTVSFMVVNNALVAVTTQTSFKFVNSGCVSYYSDVAIPPCGDRLVIRTGSEWRRNHGDGPIDDRWTSFNLEIDEKTGRLTIVEGCKEWYEGSQKAGMAYYHTTMSFKEPVDHLYESEIFATSLPNAPVLRLRHRRDDPQFEYPFHRWPGSVHPVHQSNPHPLFTSTKVMIRSYNISASTVLELVDDPLPTDWKLEPRLRLKADSRNLAPPLLDHTGVLTTPPDNLALALQKMFIAPPVTYWPPDQDPDNPDEALDKIYKLLNPPGHFGNVEVTVDERSLVYGTGGRDRPQAIIFISFDPATRLEGLKCFNWPERNRTGTHAYVDLDELDRTVVIDQTNSGTNVNMQSTSSKKSPEEIFIAQSGLKMGSDAGGRDKIHSRLPGAKECRWGRKERAMYRYINLGYYFGW